MRMEISAQPRLLHVLRGVVRYYAQKSGFSESQVDALAMAVDEAAANVIRHTYQNRPNGKMSLEVLDFADRLEFVIEDSGPKVQPECVRPRSLDEVRPGGLGTFFIKCFVDSSSYDESFTEGNRLRLVKFKIGGRAED